MKKLYIAIMAHMPNMDILLRPLEPGEEHLNQPPFKYLPPRFNFSYPGKTQATEVRAFDLTAAASIMDIVWHALRPIEELAIYWNQLAQICQANLSVLAPHGRPNLFFVADGKIIVPVLVYDLVGKLSIVFPEITDIKKYSSDSGMRIFLRQQK